MLTLVLLLSLASVLNASVPPADARSTEHRVQAAGTFDAWTHHPRVSLNDLLYRSIVTDHRGVEIALEVTPAPTEPDLIEVAIATAEAQIGTPYRWGGTSPGGFDCSGLVLFSFGAAGVDVPRTSSAQFGALPRVPLDQLRRGDLVFSGPGRVTHVGIYLGDGLMVHSPRSGRTVAIDPLHTNAFAGGRPVGA